MTALRSTELCDDTLAVAAPVEEVLTSLFRAERARWSSVDDELARLIDDLSAFVLRGGKRLRPAFVLWGSIGAGGQEDDPGAIKTAAAMELLHTFALLHDDVMDGSSTRRGNASYHERMLSEHTSGGWVGESRRFGEGSAILLGDLAFAYSDRLLADAPTDVRCVWDELRIELTMGQYLDLKGAARGHHDLERAERIALYKSGRYTVERPLHLGAASMGRFSELAPCLSRFGVPLGEAFQLRDDLLGALGSREVTGKPVGDDFREGKPTVLMAYAHAMANSAQRERLRLVGRSDLSEADVAEIQQVLLRCGAVDLVEDAIARRVRAALEALNASPLSERATRALTELADRLAWRDR